GAGRPRPRAAESNPTAAGPGSRRRMRKPSRRNNILMAFLPPGLEPGIVSAPGGAIRQKRTCLARGEDTQVHGARTGTELLLCPSLTGTPLPMTLGPCAA